MSPRTKLLLAAGLALLAWLLWPRAGIQTFHLEPVVIHAGGDDDADS